MPISIQDSIQNLCYDLTTKFYASTRVYRKKIENAWIFYVPDFAGLPMVVSSLVNSIYESFQNGAIAQDVIELFFRFRNTDRAVSTAIIQQLMHKGYIKKQPTPEHYVADNFMSTEQIKELDIWLHVSNNCNLNCAYCFVTKSKTTMKQAVMNKIIDGLISTCQQRKIEKIKLKFAGGEPTMAIHKLEWFYDTLLRKSKSLTTVIYFAVLSNGTLLTKRIIDFLKRKNVGISISLDGYGHLGHDIYRKFVSPFDQTNNGTWETITKNIALLLEHNIKPYIATTISGKSSAYLPELVTWIFKNKLGTRLSVVRQPEGATCHNMNDSARINNRLYAKLTANLIHAFDEVFTELEKPFYAIDILKHLQICELYFKYPHLHTCCGINTNHIVIREDGKVASCPMTLQDGKIELNNDFVSMVREIFPFSPNIRNQNKTDECLHCQWFPVCVGGCPVTNTWINGHPFTLSPLHDFYMYVIPRYIDFYGKKILQHAQKVKISDLYFLEYNF